MSRIKPSEVKDTWCDRLGDFDKSVCHRSYAFHVKNLQYKLGFLPRLMGNVDGPLRQDSLVWPGCRAGGLKDLNHGPSRLPESRGLKEPDVMCPDYLMKEGCAQCFPGTLPSTAWPA